MDTSINSQPSPSFGGQAGEVKTTAKDFFLHLGAIVALYTVTISFLNLVFKIIDKAYPEILDYNYYYYGMTSSEISMPVAALIIVFPIFILLSYFVYKTYELNPVKKELGIRKWLTYITLFVAGLILVGDLVMVLYKFLDGQNLTAAFLLKALVVIIVTGCVFGFYLQDIRDRVMAKMRKVWAIGIGIIILVAIVLGFSVLGSPQTQRLYRYDDQKIMDLQNMQSQVINYWQTYGKLPQSVEMMPIDEQTGKGYEFRIVSDNTFELCAEFNMASGMSGKNNVRMATTYPEKVGMYPNDTWEHKAGRYCFTRTLDLKAYPVYMRQ